MWTCTVRWYLLQWRAFIAILKLLLLKQSAGVYNSFLSIETTFPVRDVSFCFNSVFISQAYQFKCMVSITQKKSLMCNTTSQTIVKIYNPLQVLPTPDSDLRRWVYLNSINLKVYTMTDSVMYLVMTHTTIHFTCGCIKIDQSDCKHIFGDAKIYNNNNNKLFIKTNLIVCKYKSTIAGQQKHGTLGCTESNLSHGYWLSSSTLTGLLPFSKYFVNIDILPFCNTYLKIKILKTKYTAIYRYCCVLILILKSKSINDIFVSKNVFPFCDTLLNIL